MFINISRMSHHQMWCVWRGVHFDRQTFPPVCMQQNYVSFTEAVAAAWLSRTISVGKAEFCNIFLLWKSATVVLDVLTLGANWRAPNHKREGWENNLLYPFFTPIPLHRSHLTNQEMGGDRKKGEEAFRYPVRRIGSMQQSWSKGKRKNSPV